MAKKHKIAKKIHSHKHFHLWIVILSVVVVIFGYLLLTINSNAKSNLNYQEQLAKKQCEQSGKQIINITQRVLNSVDSGEGGNNWAFDNYNRQIKVYKQSENTFCALVTYEGKFDSQADQKSPGNTGILTGKEDGTFKGGYRATIKGSMIEDPEAALKGNIGTVDYQCDISGNCPGAYNWMTKYFNTSATGFTSNLDWWGWTYKYKNKSWINSSEGNSGDII